MGQQDWNLLGKHIFKPNAPIDARELVNSDSDIVNIDSAYVGMIVTVNSNPIKRYKIKKVTWEGHPDSLENGGYELIQEPKDLKYSDGVTPFLNNNGNIDADYLKFADINGSEEEKSTEDDFNVKTDTLRIDGTTYENSKKLSIRNTIGALENITSMQNVQPVIEALNNRTAKIDQQTNEVRALGYKVLSPNLSFASQVTNSPNTIFEIKDCFENIGTSQTPFEMADNSTIKFNGGKISGKIIGNNLRVIGYVEDKTAFPNGYNLNDSDFLVASEIGMIADDSTAAAHNGSVLDAVIAKQKNLVIDKYYYFDSGHEFDYPFEITGGGTIDTTTGSNEGFLIPVSGAAIQVSNLNLKLYHSFGSGFIKNENCNFLIPFIEFTNCSITNGRPCTINFIDYHAETNPWGVNTVLIANNVLNTPYIGFVINNCVIWKSCLFKGNSIYKIYGVGFTHAITNEYTLNVGNDALDCDIIVDGNLLDNTGYISKNGSYVSLIEVEGRKCIYKNNIVTNLIVLSSTGTAYDTYVNCAQFDYLNNSVSNMLCIPIAPDGTETPHNTIAHSKGPRNIPGLKTYRVLKNNVWRIDYDWIRDQIEEIEEVSYQDTDWNNLININICQGNAVIDYKILDSNLFESNGNLILSKQEFTNFTTIKITNNTFKCKKIEGWYASKNTQTLILSNNTYEVSDNTSLIKICGYQGTNNMEYLEVVGNKSNIDVALHHGDSLFSIDKILFSGNIFQLAQQYNVLCTDKNSIFSHTSYTKGLQSLYVPRGCNVTISQFPQTYDNNLSGHIYSLYYSESTSFIVRIKSTAMRVDESMIVSITKNGSGDDTMTIKDAFSKAIYSGVVSTSKILLNYAYGEFRIQQGGNGRFYFQANARTSKYIDIIVEFHPYSELTALVGDYDLAKGTQKYNNIPLSFNGTDWTDMMGFKTTIHIGTSTQRPSSSATSEGAFFYDRTLHKPLFRDDNGSWRDANGEHVGLQVSDTSVLIGAAAGSKTVSVYYGGSTAPTITVLNSDDTANTWLTATPDPFTGNTLTLTAAANDTSAPRGAKVLITLGDELVIINVVQSY